MNLRQLRKLPDVRKCALCGSFWERGYADAEEREKYKVIDKFDIVSLSYMTDGCPACDPDYHALDNRPDFNDWIDSDGRRKKV